MKKNLQNLLLASAVLGGSLTALAQPTLTGANTNASIGEIYTTKSSTVPVSPGSPGANQTWNLTAFGAGTAATSTAVSVASTPSAASFPSANIAFYDGASYAYYNISAASWLNQGTTTAGVLFAYSNPETLLSFPLTYNTTYNDTWACVFTNASITFTRTGTTVVTADGYGTVTTPATAYSNALRLHIVQTYTDVTMTITITYTNDEYAWFVPGVHTSVASTFTLTNSFTAPSYSGQYLSGISTGINSYQSLASNFSLFPNPASTEVNLSFSALESSKADLKICDVTGKQLQTVSAVNINTGENNLKISTADLAPGIYFMGVYMNGVLQKNERFVITR